MHWSSAYVGIPFGSGPKELTCWALVRQVLWDAKGLDLPRHGDLSVAYVDAVTALRQRRIPPEGLRAIRDQIARELEAGRAEASWLDVDKPREFDVCLMKNLGLDRVSHVGVMASPLMVLHTETETGSVLVPTDHPSVAFRIVGYKRHASL